MGRLCHSLLLLSSRTTQPSPEYDIQLCDEISQLTDEIRVLREAVDDLRCDVQWLCNNMERVACPRGPCEGDTQLSQGVLPTQQEIDGQPLREEVVDHRVQSVRFEMDTILAGDCVTGMQAMPAESVDLIFADPPVNIGYEYDQYDDSRSTGEYLAWTRQWTAEAIRCLKPTGTMWVAIGDEYAAEMKTILHDNKLTIRNWVIWYYTFGVNTKAKFSRSHAHLLYMVKDSRSFTFNDSQIRVPSARQLDGDERADPDGRIPDDTWILRPQDIPESFQPDEDTWHVRRVNGTFRERQGWHTCQMPEQILARIIRACSNAGDTILDPFVGSGTTPAVAKKLGRRFIGFELSVDYAHRAQQRVDPVREGDSIEGSDEPLTRESRRSSRPYDSRQQRLW